MKPLELFGIANHATLQSGNSPGDNAGLGLHTCYVLVGDTLHSTTHDARGDVNGYFAWPSLRPDQVTAMPPGIAMPGIGDPYHIAFVADADQPTDATIAPWPLMATYLVQLLRHGPGLREWMQNDGLSGFYAAHFLGSKVPNHVRAGASNFPLLKMQRDIREMAYLTKALQTANPDWVTRNTVRPPRRDRGVQGP